MNWKAAGMAGTALLTIALSGAGAVAGANKFSGNISLAVGQTFQDDDYGPLFDESFASLGGETKLNVAFTNNLSLQVDFLGVASFADTNGYDLDRDSGVQGTAHLYYRTGEFAAGVVGGVGTASGAALGSADYYFAGVEGQYYLDNITVGLSAGYLDSDSQTVMAGTRDDMFLNGAWYVGGEVRYYANEKTTFSANVGYISGEANFGTWDAEIIHWGAKVEYRPDPKEPVSLFVAYEGRTSEADAVGGGSFDKDTHTIKVGVTFTFGVDGSKVEQDRSGPAFNQMDYGAIVVGG
ncbi:MAG: hypothetical protein KJS87_06680 [Alphaproteobacteria bacterium]|nr:hypothetical protein [Alphaproteobacteria bacterium]